MWLNWCINSNLTQSSWWLGIRPARDVNISLLGNHSWEMIHDRNKLWVQLLEKQYLHGGNYITCRGGGGRIIYIQLYNKGHWFSQNLCHMQIFKTLKWDSVIYITMGDGVLICWQLRFQMKSRRNFRIMSSIMSRMMLSYGDLQAMVFMLEK